MRASPLILGCLAATWLIWGSTCLAIKWALISLPPFFQMGTRFLVAGALLLAWMRVVRNAPFPTRRQWVHATWIGVLMLTQGAGFKASPAGLVAMATACITWSLGSVLSRRRWVLAPGAMGFASEMLCGGAALMLMSLAAGEAAAVTHRWPFRSEAMLAWAYLVVFGSLLAFNAYMVLLARASAGLASSYTFVNPVIAMLLGVWLAGKTVTAWEWWAAAVIVAGVVLLMARRWR